MVDYIDGDGRPPPLLSLGWQCERFHCLPETGAYLDQDYKGMVEMTACMNVYNVISKWRNLKGKQIHSLTDGERRLLRSLKDMGIMFI